MVVVVVGSKRDEAVFFSAFCLMLSEILLPDWSIDTVYRGGQVISCPEEPVNKLAAAKWPESNIVNQEGNQSELSPRGLKSFIF